MRQRRGRKPGARTYEAHMMVVLEDGMTFTTKKTVQSMRSLANFYNRDIKCTEMLLINKKTNDVTCVTEVEVVGTKTKIDYERLRRVV